MTGRLTDRQRAILVALLQDDRRTYRELATAMGLSSWSTIRGHLDALAELGYVTLGAQGQARSIQLTPAGREAARMLGREKK